MFNQKKQGVTFFRGNFYTPVHHEKTGCKEKSFFCFALQEKGTIKNNLLQMAFLHHEKTGCTPCFDFLHPALHPDLKINSGCKINIVLEFEINNYTLIYPLHPDFLINIHVRNINKGEGIKKYNHINNYFTRIRARGIQEQKDMGKYFQEFIIYRKKQERMIPPCNKIKWEIEAEDTAQAMANCFGNENQEFVYFQRFVDRTAWARKEVSWHRSPPGLIPGRGEKWQEYTARCERAEWEYVLRKGGKYAR